MRKFVLIFLFCVSFCQSQDIIGRRYHRPAGDGTTTVDAVIGADNRDGQSLDDGVLPLDESLNDGLGHVGVAGTTGNALQAGFQWDLGTIPAGSTINTAIITFNITSSSFTGSEVIVVRAIDISHGSVYNAAHVHKIYPDHDAAEVSGGSVNWNPTGSTGAQTVDIASALQAWLDAQGGTAPGQYFEVILTTTELVALVISDFSSGSPSLYAKLVVNFTSP